MFRRQFLTCASAGALALIAVNPLATAAERAPVHQATISLGLYFVPMMVADKLGYFADEGLDFKWTQIKGATAAMSALISGDIDYVVTVPASAARAVSKGVNTRTRPAAASRSSWERFRVPVKPSHSAGAYPIR